MNIAKRLLLVSIVLIPTLCFGDGDTQNLGDIAKTFLGVSMWSAQIVRTLCIFIGVALIAGAFIKYLNYRKNPIEVKLSVPITMLFAGLAFVGITFIPMSN